MMKRLLALIFILLIVLLISPFALILAAMQPDPLVSQRYVSTSRDAARTKEIIREIRSITESDSKQLIRVSEKDVNGILAFSTRAIPAVRGRAMMLSNGLGIRASADATRFPLGGWLNFQVIINRSDSGLQLSSMRLGSFDLPANLFVPIIGVVLDAVLGDGMGSVAVNGINSVSIEKPYATFGIALNESQRKALTSRVKEVARSATGLSNAGHVRSYYLALDGAVKAGELKTSGSALPFLAYALRRAHKRSKDASDRSEVKAALLALAIYCGHPKFQEIVGDVIPAGTSGRGTGCSKTTLGGRVDLRQHFTISAGLEAAGDSSIAFAIGEFKELLDSNRGGSGFSFDDLAADRSGIRFAETFMRASSDQRSRMIGKMAIEKAVFPRIDDLPSGLSEQQFKSRFRDVNSPAYQALLKEIDGRIDRLALFSSG